MNITLNGTPSAGKGTIAQYLQQKYGYEYVGIGELKRVHAVQKHMTIQEYNAWADAHPQEGHEEFDAMQKRLGQEKTSCIFDGRVSFYMVPHSLKLHIVCDLHEAAKRRFEELSESNTRNEGSFASVDEVYESIVHRQESDRQFFLAHYGVDILDQSLYDYVIDTTGKTISEVFEIIDVILNKEK